MPLPPPDGLPIVLGPLGGLGFPPAMACSLLACIGRSLPQGGGGCGGLDRACGAKLRRSSPAYLKIVMGRIVSPSKGELGRLKTPLQPGEKLVIDLFEARLPDEWEIYVQPHLNGRRPDVVLLNPEVGIGVFEVKDSRLRSEPRRKVGEAIDQVTRYRDEIYELYCPRLGYRARLHMLTAGLIFPFADDDQLRELAAPIRKERKLSSRYDPISGAQTVNSGEIFKIYPEALKSSSEHMAPSYADDLRSWLIEPVYSSEQREPLEVNPAQRDLISSRTKTGYRRIKGPAGSGKSVVIAARAGELAAEDQRVLVVCYNITLLHYLRDLCARWRGHGQQLTGQPMGHTNKVTWLHFHSLCKRKAYEFGIKHEYDAIWRNYFERVRLGKKPRVDDVLRIEIPSLLLDHLRRNRLDDDDRYDAIFVDEGQDFSPLWWDLLREQCKADGERLLIADLTQDVYGTGHRWTDDAMDKAGFRGEWNRLPASHRLPPAMQELADNFATRYMAPKTRDIDPPEPNYSVEADLFPCHLRWIQANCEHLPQMCVQAALDLMREDDDGDRAWADLTLLTDTKEDGKAMVALLEAEQIKTVHTFAIGQSRENETSRERRLKLAFGQEERNRKMAFWKGDPRVKVTTVKSFKGWESRLLVLGIRKARTKEDLALFYTGLTRLKRMGETGSYLTVVCAEDNLRDFGKEHFERFSEEGASQP